jgi:hypothetical protein
VPRQDKPSAFRVVRSNQGAVQFSAERGVVYWMSQAIKLGEASAHSGGRATRKGVSPAALIIQIGGGKR